MSSQQIPTVNLVIKDGLSSNYIAGITQDKKGFMWFATKYGLNRYDGNKFKVYIKNAHQGQLNSNDINKVVADTVNNRVWIGNKWNGLNLFDCEREEFSSFLYNKSDPQSLSSNEISDIIVSCDGKVWISTVNRGLELYDSESNSFVHFNKSTITGFPSDEINAISEGLNKNIYIAHPNDGLTLFSFQNKTVVNYRHTPNNEQSIPSNKIYTVYVDSNGQIWLGTDQGLSLFDPIKETFRNFRDVNGIHHKLKERVHCIKQTTDNRIWIGTNSDLCYFETSDINKILAGQKEVNYMYIRDIYWGISNPSVYCIYEDSFNNVWIGSNGGGASFINRTPSFFHSYKTDRIPGVINGLNDKEVMAICIAEDESIWMGTDGGGLNVYTDGIRSDIYSRDTGETLTNAYFSSLKDSNNDLWFGSYSGIEIYEVKAKKFSRYKSLIESDIVFSFFEDNNKNVWIATNHGIEIFNLDSKERKIFNKTNSLLSTNEIRSISQDKNGKIWIGTLNKGIYIYDCEKKTFFDSDIFNVTLNRSINQIFRDSSDKMWLATNEGLVMFSPENLNHYTEFNTTDGLACNYVCSIEEDSDKNIWMSTNTGISCFLISENRFLNYDHTDGALYGNYMNNSVSKTSEGIIFFGSINGACFFDPKNRPKDIYVPPVILTEFRVYDKSPQINTPESFLPMIKNKVSLKYNQDIFTVFFSVMDKAIQKQVEYAYRIKELGDSWINLGVDNQITFRNMPYQSYELQVRARYKNQDWQHKYSTLTIVINPPLWWSWWAKLIYSICLGAIVFYIINSYKRRLNFKSSLIIEKEKLDRQKELNEERLRFYTNITHELKTPLALILGPLEDLQSESDMSDKQVKKISLIHKNTIRLLNLVKQILEFRKTETQNKKLCVIYDDISKIVQEIGFKHKESNKNLEIEFKINIYTDKLKLYFDPEVITMIIDNLLSNAFKYTQEGEIIINLRSEINNNIEYTEIEVYDTGVGIAEEDIEYIFERYYQANKKVSGFGIGLALVKNLVDLHEGVIFFESQVGIGTSFRVRLLTNNYYPEAIHIDIQQKEKEDIKYEKPLVLLVEDDNDMRDYLAESLINSYEVVLAEDGIQGFTAASSHIPDIIISDIMMPNKDGIQLCKELKANMQTSHIPVILLTAKDTLQDKTEGYNVGADSYITKPFSASLLRSRIENLLENQKKIASLISSNISLKKTLFKDSLNKIDNEFLEKITTIVEENLLNEKIDIPSIANELSMSYSSLYRKVKALTGITTGEFIRKIRIRKSEQLLLSGKYNISEVAHLVGLNSISYFRECFKDEYGMSPSEYLKKMSN